MVSDLRYPWSLDNVYNGKGLTNAQHTNLLQKFQIKKEVVKTYSDKLPDDKMEAMVFWQIFL